MFPYDIQVVQYLTGYGEDVELPPSQQVLEQAEEITSASGCTASHFGWLNLVEGRCWYSGNTLQWVEGSEVRLRLITEADYLRCTGQETDLAEDQVLAYTTGIDLPDTFYIGSLPFHVAQHLEADLPVNGSAFVSSEVALVTLVVADRATLEAVMAQPSGDHFSEEFLVQINLDSSEEAKLALSEALLNGISGEGIAVNSRQDNEATLYTMYGGFLFLGVFLGLLFLLATALIIYYKQISEGYEDPAALCHPASGGHDGPGGPRLHPQPDPAGVLPASGHSGHPHSSGLSHGLQAAGAVPADQYRPLRAVRSRNLCGIRRHLRPGLRADRPSLPPDRDRNNILIILGGMAAGPFLPFCPISPQGLARSISHRAKPSAASGSSSGSTPSRRSCSCNCSCRSVAVSRCSANSEASVSGQVSAIAPPTMS